MKMKNKVSIGDVVKLSFIGKLEDGSIFDTSDRPIQIEVGTGKLIKGLDRAIIGMEEGEQKEAVILPEEGYGLEDPDLITTMPREVFERNNLKPYVSMMLRTPHGDCYITRIIGDRVEVNYNHPLAGKTIIFEIKVEEIGGAIHAHAGGVPVWLCSSRTHTGDALCKGTSHAELSEFQAHGHPGRACVKSPLQIPNS